MDQSSLQILYKNKIENKKKEKCGTLFICILWDCICFDVPVLYFSWVQTFSYKICDLNKSTQLHHHVGERIKGSNADGHIYLYFAVLGKWLTARCVSQKKKQDTSVFCQYPETPWVYLSHPWWGKDGFKWTANTKHQMCLFVLCV